MASGRVSMAGPFRRKWDQASLPCLYSFSKLCVKPSLGVGFPLTIVGIILAWVSRSEAEVGEWEDEDAKSEESQ